MSQQDCAKYLSMNLLRYHCSAPSKNASMSVEDGALFAGSKGRALLGLECLDLDEDPEASLPWIKLSLLFSDPSLLFVRLQAQV